MSAVATVIGLTVATTTAAIVLMKYLNEEFLSKKPNSTEVADTWIDPGGPDVQFILFRRKDEPVNMKIGDNESFEKLKFSKTKMTKIITHGFRSSIKYEVFIILKNAYLQTGDYNVVGMDWSALCGSQYITAIKGVEIAGKTLGSFINRLNNSGVPLNQIHLIGHSLGAHVVGIGGHETNGMVGRITGLDPAAPGFNDKKYDMKLDPGDACIVDVVHTYNNIAGVAVPIGHVDFYPNGGKQQPGCPDTYEIFKLSESFLCNHGRAYQLFAESIRNPQAFKSKVCRTVKDALNGRCYIESNVYMGQASTYRRGIYYFKTRGQEPYSLT